PPDDKPVPFSFSTEEIMQRQLQCHIGYTDARVHQAIRDNLHQSPLYSGKIKGVGPRYCPSIEDKVVKFADKDRHQLFLEPEGHDTNEVYLNGFSTSLPAGLQQELLCMIPGFDDVKMIRPGYAIEYDFVDPREMLPTMESTRFLGLFLAGQINGTTGYEEAACQGLMAGINAAASVLKRDPVILSRGESYIGVLTDDLIRHGVDEPYRLFTSRAEARLTLRHDNADQRLSPKGRDIGLVGDSEWDRFSARRDRLAMLRNTLDGVRYKRSSSEYASIAAELGCELGDSISLSQLAMRQGVTPETVIRHMPAEIRELVRPGDLHTALADSLYSGYINKQQAATERVNHHDALRVPENFAFRQVGGLSNEMIERLERARPTNFGQVRNIPGLTPAALSTVLVHLTSATA
ncbi:MAG TPA: FAD-dependent oxidoreductase, partial [Pyrinomonadaceae bacterium]|nr:FAD-dependent oxidoreductase [Pyrinomonadaceae bacterium]